MNLNQEQLADIEKNLREMQLMGNDDAVIEAVRGDYYEQVLIFSNKVVGWYYFTKEAVIFVGGLGITQWAVPYASVEEMKECLVGPFPTGIKLYAKDEKKGKTVVYKLSVLKRKQWLEFLAGRIGGGNR